MKLNQKFYPKAIVLRKWMVVAAAFVIGTMMLVFMYNISHQSQKKEADKAKATQNDIRTSTLASSDDMAWIGQSSIPKQSASVVAVSDNKPNQNVAEIPPLTRPELGGDPLGPQGQNTNTSAYQNGSDKNSDDRAQKRLEEKQKAMMQGQGR